MSWLIKFSTTILNKSKFLVDQPQRFISLTNCVNLKQIQEVQQGKELTISGISLTSPREPYMLKTTESAHCCSLCSTDLDVKHTDVLILSQFLRSDGCLIPRRITGLCKRQQKRVSILVAMAQKSGLMPNIAPANSKKDPKKRYGYKKFNKYFDESTIKIRF